MDIISKKYIELPSEEWDKIVKTFPIHNVFHLSSWIEYSCAFSNDLINASFIIFNTSLSPLAIVPLAIWRSSEDQVNEFSLAGAPLPLWTLNCTRPSERRDLVQLILSEISKIASKNNIKKIKLTTSSIQYNVSSSSSRPCLIDSFELQNYGFIPSVTNTNIIDLKNNENDLLANMSKSQRKIIKKSNELGLSNKAYQASDVDINNIFAEFQHAHFLSAGKITRPQSTWDIMLDRIKKQEATLFVTSVNSKNISFLYCGEYLDYAFGWSQVNLREFEKEFSPRQSLEWHAITHYKCRNFQFYEIGETYGTPTFYLNPTDKEKSIGHFKEKFGASWYPKIKFYGYFDSELQLKELQQSLATLNCLHHDTNNSL